MNRRILSLILLSLAIVSGLAIAQSKKATPVRTFTGTISDDMCGGKHTMMPGKPDAECVRACVKAGSHYGLVAPDGHLFILHGNAEQLDKHAAQKVKITGKLDGNTIEVAAIEAIK